MSKPFIKRCFRLLFAFAFLLALIQFDFIERINFVIYDQLMQLDGQPVNPDVIIVAIDEKSIHDLGRWPWSREYHRRLVEVLTRSGAKVIGFDLLFSEPENAETDAKFANAISNNNIFFAIAPEPSQSIGLTEATLPVTEIAVAAKGFGHIDFIANIDGVCRATHLFAGHNKPGWPVLSLAMLQATDLYEPKQLDKWKEDSAGSVASNTASDWYRSHPILIPYYGPAGFFKQISYVDIIDERIPTNQLKDKFILVGATAVGVGDNCATPYSHTGQNMSGVEINANLLSGMIDNQLLFTPSENTRLALVLGLGLCFALLLEVVRFSLTLWLFAGALVLTSLVTALSFYIGRLWLPPAEIFIYLVGYLVFWQLKFASVFLEKAGQLENTLFQQKRMDQITKLPNRTDIVEKMTQAISVSPNKGSQYALFIIRLGGFKSINDHFGRQLGDRVLASLAGIIKGVFKDANVIARVGGAEFAVFLSYNDADTITHAGAKLSQVLHQPIVVADKQLQLYPSIGVCLYPQDGQSAETLMDNAHSAMRRAKADKSRDLCFYSQKLKQDFLDRSALEQELVIALEEGQFELYFQPQVATKNNDITGVEALLRWHHPTRGLIPPNEFIPIAEATGFIVQIGEWVLQAACRQGMTWIKQGIKDVRMAVNISPVQLGGSDLVNLVTRTLEHSGFPAHLLELELTENIFIEDIELVQETLRQLKSLGVQLAVDDFGTGYSSLSYLQKFYFDRIKIDQSFVRDIETNKNTAEITLLIIEMAHRLRLGVIAEGIETQQQQKYLAAQSCEEIQGFYFSKPLTAKNLTSLLMGVTDGKKIISQVSHEHWTSKPPSNDQVPRA